MEKIPTGEYINSPLMERVVEMRSLVKNGNGSDLLIRFAEERVVFDERLDRALKKYGCDPLAKEGVPEWLKLVGREPEYYDIDAAARVIILEQVEQFVDQFTEQYLSETAEG